MYTKRVLTEAGVDSINVRHLHNVHLTVAMANKIQLLIALIVLCVVDAVVPLFPVLGLVLIYVVLAKPPWFLETVQDIYNTR